MLFRSSLSQARASPSPCAARARRKVAQDHLRAVEPAGGIRRESPSRHDGAAATAPIGMSQKNGLTGHRRFTGLRAARQRSRTSPCSVAGTIARSTRRATSSIDSPTASCGSADRTAGLCPRSRLLLQCPAIPWKSCERGTTRRGLSCTRGAPRRVGSGSAWTWDGRSTSCTPWHASAVSHDGRSARYGPPDRERSGR